jgi:predicted phage tail protein
VNGGDPVTSYEYSVNGGAWVKVGSSSSKSFVVHHLTAFKVYRLRLRAVNVLGAGAASASVSVTAK